MDCPKNKKPSNKRNLQCIMLDLFIITIYCFIEDDLYPAFCQANGKPRTAGFEPGLSDVECLTIEIVGHFLGYSSQKKLYEQMREHFVDWVSHFERPSCLCASMCQFVGCQDVDATADCCLLGRASGILSDHRYAALTNL